MTFEVGTKCYSETVVTDENTAIAAGSGSLPVFATPFMLALMENAAAKCADKFLEEGSTTVGTLLNVSHNAATPVGMKVIACAELIGVEGRKLIFKVTASDEKGEIGEGLHERFVVYKEKFLKKAQERKGQ